MDDTVTTGDISAPDTSTDATVSTTAATPPATAKAAIDSVLAKHSAAHEDGAATVPAAEGGEIPASKKGPIPFDVHSKALENARVKEREAALKEWKDKHGWAEQVQPQDFQEIQKIARHFKDGDVLTGIQSLLAEARKDPAVDAQLRSFHARALAAARGQQPAQAEQEPQPDLPIELADGRVVHLYSAEQQAKREAYLQKQWLSQVEQKFQPVTETVEAYKASEAARAKQQEIAQYVESTHADVVTWPGMDDKANLVAVAEEMKQMRVDEHDPREVSLALNAAYRKVVLPKLSRAEHGAVLASLKQKAAATVESTTAAAPSTIARPKNPKELASFMAQRAAARGRS